MIGLEPTPQGFAIPHINHFATFALFPILLQSNIVLVSFYCTYNLQTILGDLPTGN